jgi:hypothetical protein
MKILVKKNEQQPEITIDLKDVNYPYAIRDAFILALQIDGFSKETISEIFNRNFDKIKCEETFKK